MQTLVKRFPWSNSELILKKTKRLKLLDISFLFISCTKKGSSMVATKRWCIKLISMATVGTATK